MYLESNRMILRDFIMDDLNDLHEILGDAKVMMYMEPPYDKQKTADFLQSFCIERNPKGAFAAVLKDTGKVIGYVLFKPIDDPEIYEIGWIFNKSFWRNGYAFEICSKLISYSFYDRKLHKICTETIDEIKSVSLMKKLGMSLEGIQKKQIRSIDKSAWCDLYWYAILEEDYFPTA